MNFKTFTRVLVVLVVVAIASQGFADDARMDKMQAEIDALKASQGSNGGGTLDKLTSLMSLSGDIRLKYAMDDDGAADDKDHTGNIRARIALMGKVNDEMDMIVRVGTAKDLGGGGTGAADAWIDLGYIDWHPGSVEKLPLLGVGVNFIDGVSPFFSLDGLKGIHILAGKFSDPFYHPGNSALVGDINPEGLAAMWSTDLFEGLSLYTTASGSWVEERYDAFDADASLWAVQIAGTYQLGAIQEKAYVTTGASYYNFGNLQGSAGTVGGDYNTTETVVLDPDPDGDPGTDDAITEDRVVNDYDILGVFCELGITVGDLPVKVFADYANNLRAEDGEAGYLVGIGTAEMAKLGNIRIFYNFMDVQSDAVADAFVGTNFNAGTRGRGHKFTLGHKLMKNCVFGLEYVCGERDMSDAPKDQDVSYDQISANVVFKF